MTAGRAEGAVRRWARLLAPALLVLTLAAGAAALTACSSDGDGNGGSGTVSTSTTAGGPDAPATGKPRTIAIIAPEKGNDFGWNQQGVESARAIAEEIGAELAVSEGAGYGDIAPVYRQLVADGADWIILWASGYNTVGPQLAQETGVKTVVIGAFENGLVPDLCTDFETDAQQGAYLAGMVAALMSKSGTVGIVVSADDENWNKMAGGFIVGAKAAWPDIDIKLAQAGPAAYADAPAGKRVTESIIAAGADIIFGMGDGSSFGMIQAVENAEPPAGADTVWFIDVIGDKSPIDDRGVLLTSVVWDYVPVFRRALEQMEDGSYGTEVLSLGLAGNGIRLLESDRIPADVWAQVEQARKDIEAGVIEVPVVDRKEGLEALLE